MKFKRYTDEELLMARMVEEGEYRYRIVEASDSRSQKTSDEMIALRASVKDKNGRERFLFINLIGSMPELLKQYCIANNLVEKYEAEELYAKDCLHNEGFLYTVIQKNKVTGKYYNAITDFYNAPKKVNEPFKDDDIHF